LANKINGIKNFNNHGIFLNTSVLLIGLWTRGPTNRGIKHHKMIKGAKEYFFSTINT